MDSIDKPKQTTKQFLIKEFVVFTSQILVFFFVAVLTSRLLSDEKALAELAATKINDGSLKELLLTFSAILFVIGCFTTVQKLTDSANSTSKCNSRLKIRLLSEVRQKPPVAV